MGTTLEGHGGALAVAVARRHGVEEMFTLSGGHVFPLYDGAVQADPPLRLVDVRHEQTAVFAAEATAKLLRRPGLAVLTAGPGVTNGISAITTAHFNGSPVLVLGGRAPTGRWGAGSLQELDHPPLVATVTKRAATVAEVADVPEQVDRALALAAAPHRGPVFLDIALEALFSSAEVALADPDPPPVREPDPDALAAAARLLGQAERPVLVLGSDVWADRAEDAARRCAEALALPVVANGQGRGILPPGGDGLLVTRARSLAFGAADLVLVAGAPLDFRLGYGSFGGRQGGPPGRRPRPGGRARAAGRQRGRRPRPGPGRPGRGGGRPARPAARHRAVAGAPARPGPGRRRRRPRAAGQRGRPHPPGPGLRRAAVGPGRRRGRGRRRRRLRLLRRPVRGAGPAGQLARPRPLRLPRHRPRLRPGRPSGPPLGPGGAPARRRRGRVLPDGRGHPGPPPAAGGDRLRQQRHLGPGEAPHADAVRLRRGRRPPAPLPLRPGGHRPRSRRRAGHHPGRAGPGPAPGLRRRRPLPGQRGHRPRGRLPPLHLRPLSGSAG